MPNVDRINTIANLLLTAVVDSFADAAHVPPDRRYLSNGEVAVDCEQLAVELGSVARGTPGGAAQTDRILPGDVWTAYFTVWVHRCVPVQDDRGRPPAVDALNATAKTLHRDAAALTLFIIDQIKALDASCTYATAGPLQSYGPEGGVGGWRLDVAVGL